MKIRSQQYFISPLFGGLICMMVLPAIRTRLQHLSWKTLSSKLDIEQPSMATLRFWSLMLMCVD